VIHAPGGMVPGAIHPFTLDSETDQVVWTCDGFLALRAAGLLEGPQELLRGRIRPLQRDTQSHEVVAKIATFLETHLGRDRIRRDVSIAASVEDVPLAEIVVLSPSDQPIPAGYWLNRNEVRMMVTVHGAIRAVDRPIRLEILANAGIAEYWLVDPVGRWITVHSEPGPGGYRRIATCAASEPFESMVGPAGLVTIDALLGAPPVR